MPAASRRVLYLGSPAPAELDYLRSLLPPEFRLAALAPGPSVAADDSPRLPAPGLLTPGPAPVSYT
ncbi:MAG: hypothetical protein QUU85_00460, partial [Candidatus Eisenbacteria bacterium]|nr:hypothetical protein [Candidatus Eisenbacteria bacterium]